MGRRKTNFGNSLVHNMASYRDYHDRLTELAVSMFEWENLPDGIDETFLELTLFKYGQAVFFRDDELEDYLCLQVATNGGFNVYRIPLKRRAYAVNGYQRELTIADSVIIYNNMLRKNSETMVWLFAEKLAELDQIIRVNCKAQKTPVLVRADETQRLTLLNTYQQYEGNSPVIFGDKNLDLNGLGVLKTDAPFVAEQLYTLKTQLWNEALTYLGISNLNVQKKERLVSDEVVRNQGGTIASRYSRLNERRKACKKINDMFGLDISCNFREDYRESDDEYMFEGDSGEKDNVDILATDVRTQ